jgi:hypothetical protein
MKGSNAFFDIANSDPYEALSIDRMHNNAHGLGGKHIWPEIQEYIQECGHDYMKKFDQKYGAIS